MLKNSKKNKRIDPRKIGENMKLLRQRLGETRRNTQGREMEDTKTTVMDMVVQETMVAEREETEQMDHQDIHEVAASMETETDRVMEIPMDAARNLKQNEREEKKKELYANSIEHKKKREEQRNKQIKQERGQKK
jgi:molecular chaperone DnaK (HSP70)